MFEVRHCTTHDGILPKRHFKNSNFLSRFAVTTPAFSVNVEMSVSQKSDVSSVVEFRYQHQICKTLGFFGGEGRRSSCP